MIVGNVLTRSAQCGHNLYMRSNATLHHEVVDLSTSEVLFTEKCRNSMGGFRNMMDRMEGRLGGRLRCEDASAEELVWVCNERRFALREVNVLR